MSDKPHYVRGLRVRNAQPCASYHPGTLTVDTAFKQDEPPPMSERIVTTSQRPVLFDAEARPIYRKAGFAK